MKIRMLFNLFFVSIGVCNLDIDLRI